MKIVILLVCLAISGMVVEAISGRLKRAGGGVPISIESAPHFVSLRRDERQVCSGAFISRRHVLTAAHCILGPSYEPLFDTTVVSGTNEYDRNDRGQTIRKISPHESFQHNDSSWDIAVITLWAHVDWDERRQELALPSGGPFYEVYYTFTAFQRRSSKWQESGLQQLLVKIRYSKNPHLSGPVFYGSTYTQQSIANVDVGGALVAKNTVVGIAAKIFQNNRYLCIFVNVVKFKPFIEKFIGNKRSSTERPSVIVSPPKRPRLH